MIVEYSKKLNQHKIKDVSQIPWFSVYNVARDLENLEKSLCAVDKGDVFI